MYIPSAFQVDDPAVIRGFLQQHPFGVLVMNGPDGFPCATHLPFLVKEQVNGWVLEGHLAKENPAEILVQNAALATMIVTGVHGYVSSSVYTHVNVPTYNYETVHLSGKLEVLNEKELLQHLREVVADFEQNRNAPIDFEAWPQQMIGSYMTEITGFRLVVTKVEAAFKLSQNRNEVDFNRIITDLKQGNLRQQLLADAMLKTRR